DARAAPPDPGASGGPVSVWGTVAEGWLADGAARGSLAALVARGEGGSEGHGNDLPQGQGGQALAQRHSFPPPAGKRLTAARARPALARALIPGPVWILFDQRTFFAYQGVRAIEGISLHGLPFLCTGFGFLCTGVCLTTHAKKPEPGHERQPGLGFQSEALPEERRPGPQQKR